MDEVSSHVCLVLPSTDGKAARKIVPPRLRIPYWKGLGADSEEKHEPVSDIDTVVVDSLKALDPKRPIREADVSDWLAAGGTLDALIDLARHTKPLKPEDLGSSNQQNIMDEEANAPLVLTLK